MVLTRFFPPKWRLRIVVLEILVVSFGLVQFAKTFDKMTTPAQATEITANGAQITTVSEPTQAEVQAQLVQMLAEKYDKKALVPMPLSKNETAQIEASISALTAQLNAQSKTAQNTNQNTNQAN